MLNNSEANTRVQKYNLTAANYGLNCSKYYVIRYNMYAPTVRENILQKIHYNYMIKITEGLARKSTKRTKN